MNFEIIEATPEAIQYLRNKRKWETQFLSVVSKQELLRELELQLKQEDYEAFMFAILTYLCAGRRNEILGLTTDRFTYEKLEYGDKEYDILLVRAPNEKNKKMPEKNIPLVKNLCDIEDIMIKYVEDYVKEKNQKKELKLFGNYAGTYMNKRLGKVKLRARFRKPNWPVSWEIIVDFKLFPHYLRHCRLTHLAPIGANLLVNYAGWSSTALGSFGKLLDVYVRKNWQDIAIARIRFKV